jgi:hypothetical protein
MRHLALGQRIALLVEWSTSFGAVTIGDRSRSDEPAHQGPSAGALSSAASSTEHRQGTGRRGLRQFRYLHIPAQDRERVHLVREWVKCGKPSCRCARGLRHGPYTFLRYRYWDRDAGRDRYAREYVPRSELPRVRRWIRRARSETALGWGQAGLLRRLSV